MDYDNWKLSNNEDDELICDRCGEKTTERDSKIGMGKYDIVCSICEVKLHYCDSCDRVGEEENFSYGQEFCNDCCDYMADKATDKE